jgi:hypothetical protein
MAFYNLDMIIAVGYHVNSKQEWQQEYLLDIKELERIEEEIGGWVVVSGK